ncbi:hypothetical protein [Micromonospora cathayae]|uniref:Uncharacterized protein n=1 Tax=Micromonospora cathayae TaxID=3028804 RepID=A0ABY7ZLP2_9ACTN|nr:hypothetical protein [Micromonospora sp. HUAS 3]WDZ83820.1 hypothetical protein PVK37_25655 [Micromonospora sp. HUAS 3]
MGPAPAAPRQDRFTTTSRTYSGWTIFLTPVVGGNASTSTVDPDQFPGG